MFLDRPALRARQPCPVAVPSRRVATRAATVASSATTARTCPGERDPAGCRQADRFSHPPMEKALQGHRRAMRGSTASNPACHGTQHCLDPGRRARGLRSDPRCCDRVATERHNHDTEQCVGRISRAPTGRHRQHPVATDCNWVSFGSTAWLAARQLRADRLVGDESFDPSSGPSLLRAAADGAPVGRLAGRRWQLPAAAATGPGNLSGCQSSAVARPVATNCSKAPAAAPGLVRSEHRSGQAAPPPKRARPSPATTVSRASRHGPACRATPAPRRAR